ncbi:MAG: TIGR00366 family protein [Deltaproteobacteria bacterium]|jgi:short-chain fatty acids transporter|nr:TIGR00366 family protein [Deltaproteobacteria bacterium]
MSAHNKSEEKFRGFTAFIDWFSRWSVRWIPDAMVLVFSLTIIAFLFSWALTPHGPYELVQDWVKGFWTLLSFAMQMCLTMITGFCVADSKPVRQLIMKFATMFKTPRRIVFWFAILCGVLWWLHWAVGMMLGMILGREILARNRGLGLHYPLVASIAYAATVCSNGPSMPPPLLLATQGHFMEKLTGIIPVSNTTFDPHLLLTNLIVLVSMAAIFVLMMPPASKTVEITPERAAEFLAETPEPVIENITPAQRLDRSMLLPSVIGLFGVVWIVNFFVTKGIGGLDLNIINFIFLILGLILHKSPYSYMSSVNRGVTTVGAVIIQFPFYAGIFGIIQNSGLAAIIAAWFVTIASAESFPLINMYYSAFMNMFVPSNGSKFVIEAPFILQAAKDLGAHTPYVVNSYTHGDLWGNLIQPFWALPIIGAFRLRFQDILPYGFTLFLILGVIISLCTYFLPLLF